MRRFPTRSRWPAAVLAALLATSCRDALPDMPVEDVRASLVSARDLWRVVREDPDHPVHPDLVMPLGKSHTDGGILPALVLSPPAEVNLELAPMPGAELRLAAGVGLPAYQADPGASVHFAADYRGQRVLDLVLPTGPAVPREERVWHRAGFAIESGGTLSLSTTAVGPATAPIEAGFGLLEVVTHGTLPRTRSSRSRPNLLFVTIDTLRADGLSCYGNPRPTSPVLDALGQRGVVFERAYSTSPWTWPSTASLMTGLHPPEHGLMDYESCYLSDAHLTLAELLQSQGFTTAAFSCNPLVVADKNFDQGFETFRSWEWAPAREVVGTIAQWLAENAGYRFFAYVHLVDPHGPYEPDPEFRARWAPPEPAGMGREKKPFKPLLDAWYAGREFDRARLDAMNEYKRALYDGEVATVDRQVGFLLGELARLGLAEKTVVAVTSDHGEEFLDNGMLAHGKQLFDSSVRVPLILAGPGVPEGIRTRARAQNRFLGRTLLDLAGVPPRGAWTRGQDLLELVDHPEAAREPIFFSTRRGKWLDWEEGRVEDVLGLFAADERGTRLMWTPDPSDRQGAGRAKLFDLNRDPRALHDLAAERPDEVGRLRGLVRSWLEACEAGRPDVLGGGQIAKDELRAIGYLGDE